VIKDNLDFRHQRQAILSSNIANAETPGYISSDLVFDDALREAAKHKSPNSLTRTHEEHIRSARQAGLDTQAHLVVTSSNDVGHDLNTVSIEQEMAAMAMNTLHFNTSTEILSRLFAGIRRAITEGRG
jgi:flagellar basal-body rod protein FlgB